ncbi:MAG TPA: flavin reductase family protein [Chloroflexota bacterium]|nr:flavin reductase family protein [Chloroflexota bacterium]
MAVDESDLRRAVARFAAGVTIVAAAGKKRQPRGMTVSAFLFVSFEPPLIVASVASGVPALAAIEQRHAFGVSILAVDQQTLSDRFASEEEGRFEGVAHEVLPSGAVTIGGAIASLDCALQQVLPLGDHTILVGKVQAAAFREGRPLLYYRGKYGSFHTLTASRSASWLGEEEPSITEQVAYWL